MIGGAILLFAILAAPDLQDPLLGSPRRPAVHRRVGDGGPLGTVFLICIVVAVIVCSLAVHTAAIRLMFAMARDNALPFGERLARVHPRTNAGRPGRGDRRAGDLDPGHQRRSAADLHGAHLDRDHHDLHGLPDGDRADAAEAAAGEWPPKDLQTGGYFTLGRWGLPVNILAVVWGVAMALNLAWPREAVYGAPWYNTFGAFLYIGVILGSGLLWYAVRGRRSIGTLASHAVREVEDVG